MARYDNDQDRERQRERDRDYNYDRDRGQQEHDRRYEGSHERRHLDLGQKSNEYGSHAGWGGQGFNQGSFGSYGGQGDRFYTQSGGQGYGAQQGYYGRETGGGMSTYQGPGSDQSWNRDNYSQGRGSERWGSQGTNQGNEDYRRQDRERWEERENRGRSAYPSQDMRGHEGGWGGYSGYDRNQGDQYRTGNEQRYDRDTRGWESGSSQRNWSGSQGWVGGQQGQQTWRGGSTMGQSGDWSGQRGQHYGRGPKGWQRSDDRIRDDIAERLAQHPDVDASEIEIEVHNAEVTLKGNVDSRDSKRAAEDIAEGVFGVRDVQNQIRVSRGFWGSIKDTLTGDSGGEKGEENQKDRSGQAQYTSGDVVSAGHSGAPTHTITPSPNEQQNTTKDRETTTSRK